MNRRSTAPRPRPEALGPVLELDPEVPALIFRAGGDLLHYGALAVARSLGRAGVSVTASVEHAFSPLAASRYCAGAPVLPETRLESRERLAEWLATLAERFDRRPVVYATDDESAIVLAEQADALGDRLRLPAVPSSLPSRLAEKSSLGRVCREFGIASPLSATPRGAEELAEVVAELSFPLVVKNDAPFERLERPSVRSTTVVRSKAELDALSARWREPFSALVQEYLPPESCTDWFAHAYVDHHGRVAPLFTGVKRRSWPPQGGVTANGVVIGNEGLAAETARFLQGIGYRGIVDLDWRFDRRDGCYKLLDFNPRVGAQFSLFEDDSGLDVVRAMHLDLSGRAFEAGRAPDGDRFVVEHVDLPARYGARGAHEVDLPPPGRLHRAWWAQDDPLPAVVAAARILQRVARHLVATLRQAPEARRGIATVFEAREKSAAA